MTRTALTGALAVAVLAFAPLVVPGCGGGGDDEAKEEQTETSTTDQATTDAAGTTEGDASDLVEPQDITEAGATAIEITGDWLSAGAGSIWLSDPPSARIHRLNPESGDTVATIRVRQGPCAATDFGFGALWTVTCGKPGLARIDPDTNRAAHVALAASAVLDDGEASVGVGEGGVWLAMRGANCESCVVARVDPRSLRVVARITVDEGAAAVRVGRGAVWVTNPRTSVVQKIDPRRKRVVATTPVGPEPRFLTAGESGVWTLNQGDGSVTRLDPETGKVAATIPAEVVGPGGDITTGGGSVWVRGSGYLLTRIDPETNTLVERYGPASGSGAVIVGFGAVWISAHDVETVWRLPLARP
jgi:virginiamycin B lyase